MMAARRMETLSRHLSPVGTVSKGSRVCVLGAAGGIGQPLSLLLARNPLVCSLNLYDIANTPGVAADLSHIDSSASIRGFTGDAELASALEGCDLVLIPAGVPRKPGMTRDDLFKTNAGIVRNLCKAIASTCPKALVAIITNPVNSTVPIAAEVFKQKGCYDRRRLFGVTALDVMRANQFLAGKLGLPPEEVTVPVIGGHAGETILPLFSQALPRSALTDAEVAALTTRTQNAGTEVVEAKAGKGSATLSMAAAAAEFADCCLRALEGEGGVQACAFVANNLTHLPFFACRVLIGSDGVEACLPLGPLSPAERASLQKMLPGLESSINKGTEFARS